MKYVILLVGALVFMSYAGVCEAEDAKVKGASVEESADNNVPRPKTGRRHIDLGKEPVTQVGVMSEGKNYDSTTGFPNVVKSDSDMRLE